MEPFVQWIGGKRRLLPLLHEKIPKTYNTYFEIFLGGGTLLFDLSPSKAVAIEKNANLYKAYVAVRDDPETVIEKLEDLGQRYLGLTTRPERKSFYLEIRKQFNDEYRPELFLFLNRTCFNALYRENSKGKFNVSFGNGRDCTICSSQLIRTISNYLKDHVTLIQGDFEEIRKWVKPGDFVYMDPPYYPLKQNSFTKYNGSDFSKADHDRVVKLFQDLDAMNVNVLLSNSNNEYIKSKLKAYEITTVSISRTLNSDKTKRGRSKCEIMVRNYV